MTTYSSQAASADTYLGDDAPTTNHGTEVAVYGGEWNGGAQVTRGLFKFDISSVPAAVIVQSATLSLWTVVDYATNTRTYRIFRQLRAWTEAGATWNKYDGTNNWATAGGFGATDCEQTDIGSVSIANDTAVDTEIQWALTASAITEMVSGAFTNNGFFVKADTEANDMWGFYSSEHETTAQRPKLVIEYQFESSVSGTMTFVGTLLKTTSKPGLAGALTFAGTVAKTFIFARTILDGALSLSGTLTKQISKVLSGALTFLGDLFGRRIVPVTIYLDASPTAGVVMDTTPTEDVTLDASPTVGIPFEKI